MANMLISGVASAERIFELLDAEEQEADGEITARDTEERGEVTSRRVRRAELPGPTQGHIECDHVAISYSPDKPLSTDLSLAARPGRTVASVGRIGAGQTTPVDPITSAYD